MVFSETIFLFGFLPLVLWGYLLTPGRLKNAWLLLMSLAFYADGERAYALVMLGAIGFNFWVGRKMGTLPKGSQASRRLLGWSVAFNLLVLGVFKYANFFADNLRILLAAVGVGVPELPPVHLPIGVSFFTFQALSYVIDVYRQPTLVQRDWVKLALYISMFPQLIAGPIVRYEPVAEALDSREHRLDRVLSGVGCFIAGLAKKVLLADTFASIADTVFPLPATDLPMDVAWLGALAYALQIYFDFSGYSDMAVGLGRVLGFEFPANFCYPYVAKSVTDFWRRWHISLSSWFRDYLYIPLGGNRVSPARTYLNLWTVFLLCGLWHGAAWTYVLWGAWHGLLLVVERRFLGAFLKGRPVVGTVYTWLAVLTGWVLFRADNLDQAGTVFRGMLGVASAGPQWGNLGGYVDAWVAVALPVGAISATPLWRRCLADWDAADGARWLPGRMAFLGALLLSALIVVSAGAYSPFIYFRF